MTEAEERLWHHIRKRQIGGCKFRRQQPIGPYIADFICFEKRLIIELDGGQHAENIDYDAERDAWLRSQGYNVLRFWNNQVLQETEAVKEIISRKLNPPPESSPARGEEKKDKRKW